MRGENAGRAHSRRVPDCDVVVALSRGGERPRMVCEQHGGRHATGHRPVCDFIGKRVRLVEPPAAGGEDRPAVLEVPHEEQEDAGVTDPLSLGGELLGLIPSSHQVVVEAQVHQGPKMPTRCSAVASLPNQPPRRLPAVDEAIEVYGGRADSHDTRGV